MCYENSRAFRSVFLFVTIKCSEYAQNLKSPLFFEERSSDGYVKLGMSQLFREAVEEENKIGPVYVVCKN